MIDHPATFARHFARLVALLTQAPSGVEEQKSALRAATLAAKSGPAAVVRRGAELAVNGAPLAVALPDVGELATRLTAHSVLALHVDAGAPPAELLVAARALAAPAGDHDENRVAAALAAATAVRATLAVVAPLDEGVDALALGPATRVAESFDDVLDPAVVAAAAARVAAHDPVAALGTPERAPVEQPVEPLDAADAAGRVLDAEPETEPETAAPTASEGADERVDGARAGAEPASAPPSTVVPPYELRSDGQRSHDPPSDGGPERPGAHPDAQRAVELLDGVAAAPNAERAAELLNEVAARAELAARAGDVATVVALLGGALERLPAALDPSAAPLDAAVARLATPELLIVVAEAIARRRVEREQGVPVLARARGAADVVARLVVSAATPADRGAHRDTLAGLGGGEAQLVRLLDHGDPAVAAAAAEGLGQVGTAASHAALARALAHPNAHVRRATAAALGQLRAVSASGALRTALRDGAADVRTEAANALVALGGAGIGAALADALDGERHPAAQGELLSALGRLATPDAVQVLVQAAAPAGRLFARKPVSFRCAAVAALGVARTPAALAALRELTNDREREVREAVFAAALSAGGGARRRSPER